MKKTFLLGNAGAFVLLAVAGTLTHELGHFAMATALGYPATAICRYVFVRFVPAGQKAAFVVSRFLGGCAGFGMWFYGVGPWLLP